MQESDFFQEIEHTRVPWGERSIHVPVFYFDSENLNVLFLVPREKLEALMPSKRMHPLRITPWHAALAISAMQFRDTDIGPYNEVSISIPFTLDKPSPLFTGILRQGAAEPNVYIRHLPVTTEIARDLGVEFAGYPKFLAQIEFEKKAGWVTCHLAEAGQHILSIAVRQSELGNAPRSRMNYFTFRNGYLLRSIAISSERLLSVSKDPAHLRFELGNHPVAQELKGLNLGRMLGCQYSPNYQTILSPVLESMVA